MPHRCAFGCKDTGNVMHSFPNPGKFPERFKAWVNLVGYHLDTLTDYDIYKKKRICDIHFTHEDHNRFKRLNALAMPTLHLPVPAAQSVSSLSVTHPTTSTSLPSTSTPGVCHGIAATTQQFEAVTFSQPSTNTSLLTTSTSDKSHCTAAKNYVVMEHNYSVISRSKGEKKHKDARWGGFNSIPVRSLQTKVKYLQNEIRRLRKKDSHSNHDWLMQKNCPVKLHFSK